MNVDLATLTNALHQVATTTQQLQPHHQNSSTKVATSSSTNKQKIRRRSSNCNDAQKFLEAAHKSWTFSIEDLPDESRALQRRKSTRKAIDKKFVQDAHKSWPPSISSREDASLMREACPSRPPPLNGKKKQKQRRASFSGSTTSSTIHEPTNKKADQGKKATTLDANQSANNSKLGKKLARRSSLQCVSDRSLAEEKVHRTIRRATTDPTPTPSTPKVRGSKMERRATINGTLPTDVDDLPLTTTTTSSPKGLKKHKKRRSSSIKTSSSTKKKAPKGPVRFALDHKNRIKRQVNTFRSQASRRDPRALWWSEEELDRIYERENAVYEKYSSDPSYKKSIRQLWCNCSKAQAKVPLSPDAITHVAGSPSRGLEVDILETVRERRLRVLSSVLDAQEALRDFDSAIRMNVLSARYKNLSRSATRFARKMAEGDALVAANVYSN